MSVNNTPLKESLLTPPEQSLQLPNTPPAAPLTFSPPRIFKILLGVTFGVAFYLSTRNEVVTLSGEYDSEVKGTIVFGYLLWLLFLCLPVMGTTEELRFTMDVFLGVALFIIAVLTFVYKSSYDHNRESKIEFAIAMALNSGIVYQLNSILVYIEMDTTEKIRPFAGFTYHQDPAKVNEENLQLLQEKFQALGESSWIRWLEVLANSVVIYSFFQFFFISIYNDFTVQESYRFTSAYILFVEIHSFIAIMLVTSKVSRLNKIVCAARDRFDTQFEKTILIFKRYTFGEEILLAIVIPTMLELATTITLMHCFR